MSLCLAVDAGGTRTTYLLADGAAELARAEGGSIKRLRVSAELADSHLNRAFDDLELLSGRSLGDVVCTCVGAAGASVPLVADWLHSAIARRAGGVLLIVGDVEIALDAAFAGGRGVLALAGTGSNVAARLTDGRLTGAGGWGPAAGDEGSGYEIGRAALRAVFRAADRDEPPPLLNAVQAFWGVAGLPALVQLVNGSPPQDFAQLVPLVAAAAAAGDPLAEEVLRHQGQELGRTVLLAIARMRRMEADHFTAPEVACAGSVLQHVPVLRQSLEAEVKKAHPDVRFVPGSVEPVQGALWRARMHLG